MNQQDVEHIQKLKKMSRADLQNHFKAAAQSERECLHDVLLVIKEVERRQLYLDHYASLWEFVVTEGGYSNGSAQRRIDAARLLAGAPEISDEIKSGAINLTQTTMVQRAAREKSQRTNVCVSAEEKIEVLHSLRHKNQADSEQATAAFFETPIKEKTRIRTQANFSVRMDVTFTEEQFAHFKEAQSLGSHSIVSKDPAALIDFLALRFIKEKTGRSAQPLNKKSSAKNEAPNSDGSKASSAKTTADVTATATVAVKSAPENPEATAIAAVHSTASTRRSSPKSLPERVRKIILDRDQYCVQKNPKTGKLCGSTWQRQVDHIVPRWAGGSDELSNLQCLCGVHNRVKYQRQAGIRRTP